MVTGGSDLEIVGKAKQAAESVFGVIDLVHNICAHVFLC